MTITREDRKMLNKIKEALGLNERQVAEIVVVWNYSEPQRVGILYQLWFFLLPLAMALVMGYGYWQEAKEIVSKAGYFSMAYGIVAGTIGFIAFILVLFKGDINKDILVRRMMKKTITPWQVTAFRISTQILWAIALIINGWTATAFIVIASFMFWILYEETVKWNIKYYLRE